MFDFVINILSLKIVNLGINLSDSIKKPTSKFLHIPQYQLSFKFNNLIRKYLKNTIVLQIKSHTSEEGGAHLRISFWHLLMNLKNK